jgi:hypothetical protein
VKPSNLGRLLRATQVRSLRRAVRS